jgi:hypothetical protein
MSASLRADDIFVLRSKLLLYRYHSRVIASGKAVGGIGKKFESSGIQGDGAAGVSFRHQTFLGERQ